MAVVIVLLVALWLSVGLSVLAAWYVDEQMSTPLPALDACFIALTAPLFLIPLVVTRWLKGGYGGKRPAQHDDPDRATPLRSMFGDRRQ